MISLSGCSNTVVTNPNPSPKFYSCDSLRAIAKSKNEALVNDAVSQTNINLKLREVQPKDERDKLINCGDVGD